jgi:hypothetical protein
MSTRNLTMVVDREEASHNDLGFACNPDIISDKSYVNMYLHHDGYPAWQGVQLAKWVKHWQDNPKTGDYHMLSFMDGAMVASRLVHDHYYDSCYLYPNVNNIDHAYTYIIWTGKDDVWISCYSRYDSKTVFVLQPDKIIEKYGEDMEYTDWGKEIRYKQVRNEDYKLNTNKDG